TLHAGSLNAPAAMRSIHSENRMTRQKDHDLYRDLWWRSLRKEFRVKNLEKSKYVIFDQCYINYFAGHSNKLLAIKAFLRQCVNFPDSINKSYGNFDFNVWKVFGKNWVTRHLVSFKNRLLT
ncbi:MAG: hypothetical protein AAF688_15755, partial [Bacteroidota bacterium]